MLFGKKKEEKIKTEKPKSYDDNVFDMSEDDFDLGFDFDDSYSEGRIRRFGRGFLSGFDSEESKSSIISGLISGALPDSYSNVYTAGAATWKSIKENVSSARDNNAETLLSMSQKVEDHLPKFQNRIKKKYYDRIEKGLSETSSSLKDTVDLKRSYESLGATTDTKADDEERTLQGAVRGLFRRSEKKSDARAIDSEAREDSREHLRMILGDERFKTTLTTLQNLEYLSSRQVSYQDRVTSRFQRKQIELGYRQFFALRDIRRLMAVGIEHARSVGEVIVHNTSLPDFNKQRRAIGVVDDELARTEVSRSGVTPSSFSPVKDMHEVLMARASARYKESLPQYLAEFYPTIQKNIQKNISEFLSGADTLTSMGGALNPKSVDAEVVGNEAGRSAGGMFGDYIMPRLGSLLEPHFEGITEKIRGRNYKASYMVDNAPSILQDFAHNYNEEDGTIKGILRRLVRANIPEYSLQNKLEEGSFNTLERPVPFNHLSQRSLVEIIPGYLSRLLHETRMMRTGDESIEREVYDITKGRFVKMTDSRRGMRSRIVSDTEREGIRSTLDNVINTYDQDGELSADATAALRDRLMTDAAQGGRFDVESYMRGEFNENVAEETRDELVNFFRRQFDADADGKLTPGVENYRRENDYGQVFRQLKEVMPNSKEAIERVHGTGSQELLREMGIVYSSHGNDYIDFSKLWSMYRGDDELGNASDGPSPTPGAPGAPGPSGPTMSPTMGPGSVGPNTRWVTPDGSPTGGGGLADILTGKEQYTPVDSQPMTSRMDARGFSFKHRPDVDPIEDSERSTVDTSHIPYSHKKDKGKPITFKRLFDEQRENFSRLYDRVTDTGTIQVDSEGVATPLRKNPISAFSGILKKQWETVPDFKDLYNRIGNKIILKRDITVNKYIDVNTGKVIESVDDITGPVVDEDDNLVITQEDFERGLYDVHGEKKAGEGDSILDRASDNVLGKNNEKKKNIMSRLGSGFAFLKRRYVDPRLDAWKKGKHRDAYLPGEETPRITVQGIKDGKYFDNKGKVIKHIDDIGRSTIFDEYLNVVIAEDELPNLVDAFGKPHRIASNLKSTIRTTLRNAARRYKDWTIDYYKKLPGRVGNFAKGVGSVVKNTVGFFNGKPLSQEDIAKKVDNAGRKVTRAKNTLGEMSDEFYNNSYNSKAWKNFDAPEVDPGPSEEDLPKYTGEKKKDFSGQSWGRSVKNKRDYRWVRDEDREVPEDTLDSPSDALLNRIDKSINGLKEEEHRKGSWQQIFEDRQNKKEDKSEKKEEDKGFTSITDQLKNVFGPLGKALGGIGGLLGLGGAADAAAGAAGGSMMGSLWDRLRGRRGGPGGAAGGAGGKGPGLFRRAASGIRGAATGTVARQGAGLLGRALLLGATTPVGWGVIAASAAAYGGYKLWQRHQETAGKLYRIRFGQYGIDPTDREVAIPVLNLEELIEEGTRRSSDGKVDLNLSHINDDTLYEIFNIEEGDEFHLHKVVRWFTERFIPVWKFHNGQLGILEESGKLTEIDKEISSDEKALEFIDMIERTPLEIYAFDGDPFTREGLSNFGWREVKVFIDDAREYYERKARRSVDRKTTRQTGILAGMSNDISDPANLRRGESDIDTEEEELADASSKARGPGGVGATPDDDDTHGRSSIARQANTRSLSFLQKFRGYAYGLSHFDDDMMDALLTMEDDVFKHVSIDSDGQAIFTGRSDHFLSEHSEALGIAWGVQRMQMRLWRTWFSDRFINVVLAYVAKLHQIDPAARPSMAGNQLSRKNQISIANAIMGSGNKGWFRTTSIWDMQSLTITGHDSSMSLALAEELLAELTSSETPSNNTRAHNPMPLPAPLEPVATGFTEEEDRPSVDPTNMGGRYRSEVHNQNPSGYGATGLNAPMRPGGGGGSRGAVYGGLQEGTGGVYDQIPMPRANRDREAAMETLKAVEAMTGVDAELLATKAFVESSFNYNAGAGTSSAKGWFQFIDTTWDAVVKKYGPQYGIHSDPGRALRMDPRINALMGAELLKENYKALERRTGRPPTDTDLYLAHFMGAGNAGSILTNENKNAIAAQLYPNQAKANQSVFYHSNGQPLTLGELIQWADSKMAPGRREGADVQYADSHHTPDELVTPTTPVTPLAESGEVVDVVDEPGIGEPSMEDSVYGPRNHASVPVADDVVEEPTIDEDRSTQADRRYEIYNEIERSGDPYGPRVTTYNNQPSTDTESRDVEQRRQRVLTEQREHERRQRDNIERSSEDTVAIGGIAQRQLETQQEMSSYLRRIAEQLDVFAEKENVEGTSSNSPNQQTSNDTSIYREATRPADTTSRSSPREPSSVSMNR